MITRRVGAIIVAAGKGRRMGGVDKMFALLGGRPVLARVVDTFQRCKAVDQIVVVVGQGNLEKCQQLVAEQGWSKVSEVCPGGERRQDSIPAAGRAASSQPPVLGHTVGSARR